MSLINDVGLTKMDFGSLSSNKTYIELNNEYQLLKQIQKEFFSNLKNIKQVACLNILEIHDVLNKIENHITETMEKIQKNPDISIFTIVRSWSHRYDQYMSEMR